MVTLISVMLLEHKVSAAGLLGITLLSLGIYIISLKRPVLKQWIAPWKKENKGTGLALLTGLFIAAYTLIDQVGVNAFGSPFLYGYFLFCLVGLGLLFYRIKQYGLITILTILKLQRFVICMIGVLFYLSYMLTLYAMLNAPISYISAIREVSILFVVALGVWMLNEKITIFKALAAVIICSGVMIIKFS
jgi:drug/metabolite transporter (DMT)-like permease